MGSHFGKVFILVNEICNSAYCILFQTLSSCSLRKKKIHSNFLKEVITSRMVDKYMYIFFVVLFIKISKNS